MRLLIVLGSILVPVIMLYLKAKLSLAQLIFNIVAVICALVFGNIAAVSIYNVIADDAVFMTTIHGVFLNPFFIITGAYLGLYMLYLLIGTLIPNKYYT